MENNVILDEEKILKICPRYNPSLMRYLKSAMIEGKINTPERAGAFIAQLAHESGEFLYMEEIRDGSNYEGRRDLGNIEPGDGRKFKGRGPIQITGRYNYSKFNDWMKQIGYNQDFLQNPELVAESEFGFLAAVWFWSLNHLNKLADQKSQSSFDKITYIINGGYNGKADRDKYYKRAAEILGFTINPN